MIVEARGPSTEPTAELVKALVDIGKLERFAAMVEDGHCAWHCICMLEEDLLAFAHRNRWCGSVEGWRTVVGSGTDIQPVPEYVGWGHAQAWLEHYEVSCVVEPGYGLVCRTLDDFVAHHRTIPWASAPFCDESGIILNRAMREMQELESAL